MLDCCVVFGHFRNDRVTRTHLRLLRRLNPYPVVAVCDDPESAVAGALDVGRAAGPSGDESAWAGCDSLLYRWFRHGGLRARRYIYLEWDALATVPLREYYEAVWDADAAASRVYRVEEDYWSWFEQVPRLPGPLRARAAGVSPTNGVLLSHRALEAITAAPTPPDVFAELRLGSLLRGHGFEPVELPPGRAATNTYHPELVRFGRGARGLFHPVKGPAPRRKLDPK